MGTETPAYAIAITLLVFSGVIGIDIALAVNKRQGDTYSEVIRTAARKWWPLALMICFGMGLLAGHWFWSPVEVVSNPKGVSQ